MTNEELMALVAVKKAELESKDSKLAAIREGIADLGELPTLTKLRNFLSAIRTLMEDSI